MRRTTYRTDRYVGYRDTGTDRKPDPRYTCPTCGTPEALTEYERRKGYHCLSCTRQTEGPC